MKRAVLYLRVSTIEQTTANQERELRDVASRMGCEIVHSAFSALSPVQRPQEEHGSTKPLQRLWSGSPERPEGAQGNLISIREVF
jgi:hypothetical protein